MPPISRGIAPLPFTRFRQQRQLGRIQLRSISSAVFGPPASSLLPRLRLKLIETGRLAHPRGLSQSMPQRLGGSHKTSGLKISLCCCLTYPLQRTARVFPARCPGRVLLGQVPFGQTSSLHPLRRRLPGLVRGLRRYFRSVRLPRSVPMRPKSTVALGGPGISRFPREVFPYVHGVSDRAGLWHTLRYRCTRWSLPLLLTASAPRR
jgi:hypothetical protein